MRVFLVLLALLVTPPALAARKSGVTLPDQVQVGGKVLALNGIGLREATFLKVDVYVAGLYLEHPSSDPATILGTPGLKRIVLHFVRDVSKGDIVKAWNEGFSNNAVVPVGQLQPEIARLNAWMPSFKKGDTLVLTFYPGVGVTVDVNGTRKGVLPGDDFARSLLSIWLGPKPPTAELKRSLLGHHPEAG